MKFTANDLMKLKRVSDLRLSPDGKWLAYVIAIPDVARNKMLSNVWVIPSAGGEARQLSDAGDANQHPRWNATSDKVLVVSDRSGKRQLWSLPLSGKPKPMTSIETGAESGLWVNDDVAYLSEVLPKGKSETLKVVVHDSGFVRQWDRRRDAKRYHVFLGAKDLTPGDYDASPLSPTYQFNDDFCIAPDGKSLVVSTPPQKELAWSTNHDLFQIDVASGTRKNLTEKNLGADSSPRFSPDGKLLAYLAQSEQGNEADEWKIVVRDMATGKTRFLADDLDLVVTELTWAPDSKSVYFTAFRKAKTFLARVYVETGEVSPMRTDSRMESLSASATHLFYLKSSFTHPGEIYALDLSTKEEKKLSTFNDVSAFQFPKPEDVEVMGDEDCPMQMWIFRPTELTGKLPLMYWVHGGPEHPFEDAWSFRWNPQTWVAQGYVLAMPNPRGSFGFGAKYCRDIRNDWGGSCYRDLMKGLEYMEGLPYVDSNRMMTAGASFGGYMMAWFNGQTDKFKAQFCHCGLFNLDSFQWATEEMWFPEYHMQNKSHSPHLFMKQFKTPTLIVHNELDFRVPITEGVQYFNALQRQGVPSRFVSFEDEGHWILKPANAIRWHEEIFRWFDTFVPRS